MVNEFMGLISAELEQASGRPYDDLLAEIWNVYQTEMMEHFPYIGGDEASGTKNLTGAYVFVAMGEVLKKQDQISQGSRQQSRIRELMKKL